MRRGRLPLLLVLGALLTLSACGPTRAEREAADRARLELEEKNRREAEQANQAISEMNRKMFGKKPQAATKPEKPEQP